MAVQLNPFRRLHRSWLLTRGEVRLRAAGSTARFHLLRELDYLYLVADIFEREQLNRFLPLLRPDDVIYEVGSHIGSWTVFMAQRVPRGSVHAFEPHGELADELRDNVELNGLGNVEIHRLAVGPETGTGRLGIHPRAGDGRHSLIPLDHHRHLEPIEMVRLDDVARKLGAPPPTVLKVDCEGAEGWVFEGGREQLSGNRLRLIYLELHPGRIEKTGHGAGELLERLAAAGFEVRERWPRAAETLLVLERP